MVFAKSEMAQSILNVVLTGEYFLGRDCSRMVENSVPVFLCKDNGCDDEMGALEMHNKIGLWSLDNSLRLHI